MLGCLTWPFRMLGCLGLIVALGLGWLYRDRLMSEAERLVNGAPPPAEVGRPAAGPLRAADRALGELRRGAVDSIVLDADEAASLMRRSLPGVMEGRFDSMEVRLGDGAVTVRGLVRTSRLPAGLVGPLAVALREWERVEASGPLRMAGPGRAEWRVREASLRDFPLPHDAVPRLLARALGDTAARAFPVQLPRGVSDLRVEPAGVILYGASQR